MVVAVAIMVFPFAGPLFVFVVTSGTPTSRTHCLRG
jgi:hypothetical protein